MTYATKADLVPRRITTQEAIELTDDTNSGNVVEQTIIDVLAEASGTIDSYCRVRYSTPLQTSEQVKGLCLDIAEYILFSRRRRCPETVKDRFSDAIKMLRDICDGKAALDQPTGALPQTSNGPAVATEKVMIFSDDNLKGYC
jgi:phage gp36-like protein